MKHLFCNSSEMGGVQIKFCLEKIHLFSSPVKMGACVAGFARQILLTVVLLGAFLAQGRAQGEGCQPLQNCNDLSVELIRVSGPNGSFGDCAGNSGCGKVYYKAFLRYSGPQTTAFNLPYQDLSLNVFLNSVKGFSYIDVGSTQQCFKNADKWPSDVFQVSSRSAGLHLMVGEGQGQPSTCQDPKKRVKFAPGTPPAGSASCPSQINDCMYAELFTLVVNAVPGDTISLWYWGASYSSEALACSKLKLENSFNTGNNANAILPYAVPALPIASLPYNSLSLEVGGVINGINTGLYANVRNRGSADVFVERLEFTVEIEASTSLLVPVLRLSFGLVSPSYVFPVPGMPNKYQLRYVLRNITIPANDLSELGEITVNAPQPNNQYWWASARIVAGTTLLESAGACMSAPISSNTNYIVINHGQHNPCDTNVNPVQFFIRPLYGACSGTEDIEIGLSVTGGYVPIIEELHFEVDFEVQAGTNLSSDLNTDHWFSCTDCTPPELIGNTLQCHFTTSGVNFQGERKIILSYGDATGCLVPNVRILLIKYKNISETCYPFAEVERICPPNIGGSIETEAGQGIGNVSVTVAPSASSCGSKATNTLLNGRYGVCFQNCGAGTYTVTPYKNDNPLNGVTTLDLAMISKHILNLTPLGSPYKLIAADANKSGTITTLDIVALRRLILGIDSNFANNTSWRFIDKAYVFPNPSNPFVAPFPVDKQIVFNGTADFIGVKTGDVNESAQPAKGQPVQVSWPVGSAYNNGTLIVPVYYSGHTAVECLQLGLRFNAAQWTLVGTLPGELTGWNKDCFGLTKAAQGEVRTLWLPMNEAAENPVKPGMLLFSLVFKARKAPGETNLSLALDDQILRNTAWTAGSMQHPILKGREAVQRNGLQEEVAPALLLRAICHPNPASEAVQFTIESGQETQGRVALFNALGQRVFVRDVPLVSGQQTLSFPEFSGLPCGIYIWKVYGGDQKVQGNIVLD